MGWKPSTWRWVPLFLLGLLLVVVLLLGGHRWFRWSQLGELYLELQAGVLQRPFWAWWVFSAVYCCIAAISLPGASFLSVLAGLLFPFPWGLLSVLVGATGGASLVFLATRAFFGSCMADRGDGALSTLYRGFQEGAVSYLLVLRLIPLFPFWMVNLAAGLFRVHAWTFVWTTFVGITPGAFALTQVGAGAGSLLAQGEDLQLDTILTPEVKVAIVAVVIVALIPIVWKRWWRPPPQP